MRITIPVVIEMTGEQVADYALGNGLPRKGGKLMAREVVEDVRDYVLSLVQDSANFYELDAVITIKR